MDAFTRVVTSASGRPVLMGGEIEKVHQEGVAVYQSTDALTSQRVRLTGLLTLTTHRLLWMHTAGTSSDGTVLSLPLSKITGEPELRGGVPPFTHNKIVIKLADSPEPCLYLSFRLNSAAANPFWKVLCGILHDKPWHVAKPAQKPVIFSTSNAGVGGLMRAQEMRHRNEDSTLQQAFSDLNVLMERAKEVASLAERISAALDKQRSPESEGTELKSLLMNMGITNPVTRESTGSSYHAHLARELAESLAKPIQQSGGMMTLTDAYCLVNRARGTELISPDDMVAACKLFAPLSLSLHLRKFESGVIVLHNIMHTDEIVTDNVLRLCKNKGNLSVLELAKSEGLSVLVAEEQLLLAESMGALCRDETVKEIRFWPNIFK